MDIYQGYEENLARNAKDEYWQGGTKLGMVGAERSRRSNRFSGTSYRNRNRSAVGAGIGGAGALFGGDKGRQNTNRLNRQRWRLGNILGEHQRKQQAAHGNQSKGASNAGTWDWNGTWIRRTNGAGSAIGLILPVWTPAKDIGFQQLTSQAGVWGGAKERLDRRQME